MAVRRLVGGWSEAGFEAAKMMFRLHWRSRSEGRRQRINAGLSQSALIYHSAHKHDCKKRDYVLEESLGFCAITADEILRSREVQTDVSAAHAARERSGPRKWDPRSVLKTEELTGAADDIAD